MQMDEISREIGLDLQTEALLVRAEQLARLETDKIVDKVRDCFVDFSFHSSTPGLFKYVIKN